MHSKTQPLTHNTNGSYWCRALLHTRLNAFQLILWLSMVVWLCEDTYLPGMYPTEWQININARKLHLYSCSGNEGISMWPILTGFTVLRGDLICIRPRFLHSTIRKSMNNIKAQYHCQGICLPPSPSLSLSHCFIFSHSSVWIVNKLGEKLFFYLEQTRNKTFCDRQDLAVVPSKSA